MAASVPAGVAKYMLSEPQSIMSHLGVVIIGRNEGERLRRCLASVVGQGFPVVYVDSNSTDGSAELAQAMGADVVQLDLSRPFTMGRGRNTGWTRLEERNPDVRFIQFVDGDCELVAGWLEKARKVLETSPKSRSFAAGGVSGFQNGRSITAWPTSSGTHQLAKPGTAAATR